MVCPSKFSLQWGISALISIRYYFFIRFYIIFSLSSIRFPSWVDGYFYKGKFMGISRGIDIFVNINRQIDISGMEWIDRNTTQWVLLANQMLSYFPLLIHQTLALSFILPHTCGTTAFCPSEKYIFLQQTCHEDVLLAEIPKKLQILIIPF